MLFFHLLICPGNLFQRMSDIFELLGLNHANGNENERALVTSPMKKRKINHDKCVNIYNDEMKMGNQFKTDALSFDMNDTTDMSQELSPELTTLNDFKNIRRNSGVTPTTKSMDWVDNLLATELKGNHDIGSSKKQRQSFGNNKSSPHKHLDPKNIEQTYTDYNAKKSPRKLKLTNEDQCRSRYEIPNTFIDGSIDSKLREYQRYGVKWMYFKFCIRVLITHALIVQQY